MYTVVSNCHWTLFKKINQRSQHNKAWASSMLDQMLHSLISGVILARGYSMCVTKKSGQTGWMHPHSNIRTFATHKVCYTIWILDIQSIHFSYLIVDMVTPCRLSADPLACWNQASWCGSAFFQNLVKDYKKKYILYNALSNCVVSLSVCLVYFHKTLWGVTVTVTELNASRVIA